ncbi:unnamed protein product, partial [Scytosiphon promiscuus]
MATRWASEEERGLDAMRTRWWWQPGPVASCCGCFTIRTGVYLLSLWNMAYGMAYVNYEKWYIPTLSQILQQTGAKYEEMCKGLVRKQERECDAGLKMIAEQETTLDFLQSMIPVYHVIGVVYVIFSLIGWRAGYTNNQTLAKLFLVSFPAAFMIDVCVSFLAPRDVVPMPLITSALIAAYCFKVAWSFYAMLRIREQAHRIVAEAA